jgi:hypothetical protein
VLTLHQRRTRLPLGLDRSRNLAPPVHAQGLLAVGGAGVDRLRLAVGGDEGGEAFNTRISY